MTALGADFPAIEPEAMAAMRAPLIPSDRGWAAYQNMDLGSIEVGALRFLLIGPARTHVEPPPVYPDTQHGLGWRYRFVGWVNLAEGVVVASVWVPA